MSFNPPPTASGGDTSRAAALRTLSAVARNGVISKDTATKILTLSMSSDHVVRGAAVPALMQMGGLDAEMMLTGLLNDPNADIQGEAADALGQLGAKPATEPLKKLLVQPNEQVALQAARALGRMKDRSGLGVAIRCLRKDNPLTRLAAHALGCIVGTSFRPNSAGVAEARRYLKNAKS